jgi:hypothetical protein
MACGPDGDAQHIVRALGTSTTDLDSLADWGIARGVQPGAMASTGV